MEFLLAGRLLIVGKADLDEVKHLLKEKLPIYMIPNVIKKVDEFQLNKNGKIDRNKLLDF